MPWKGSFARALLVLALAGSMPIAALTASAVPQPSSSSTARAPHPSRRAPIPADVDAPVRGQVRQARKQQAQIVVKELGRERRARRARRRAVLEKKHFIWPVKGWVTSGYGWRTSPITRRRELHAGVDVACAAGQRVRAPRGGRVLLAGFLPAFGRTVVIRHKRGWVTFQSHMKRLAVRGGQRVEQGQRIGGCGASGWATGPHVHFELRRPSGRSIRPGDKMYPRRPPLRDVKKKGHGRRGRGRR